MPKKIALPGIAWFALVIVLQGTLVSAHAKLKQFDVFLGYDGIVAENNWFPVVFEVLNDGPTFEGIFRIEPAQFSRGVIREYKVELPTDTRKRFTIPVFCGIRGFTAWNITVKDTRGNLRDEILDLRPRRNQMLQSPLIGSISRTAQGMPVLPEMDQKLKPYVEPAVARIQPALLSDTPLGLEVLSVIYVNAEKALELKENQVRALMSWLSAGGHLIVGLHQPNDISVNGWLEKIVPFQATDIKNISCENSLIDWMERQTDPFWESGYSRGSRGNAFTNIKPNKSGRINPNMVVCGKVLRGKVILEEEGVPLIVTSRSGRGNVTVLTFSPENEPFRSWDQRAYFWAKICGLPAQWFGKITTENNQSYGGWTADSLFGSMVDSRQIRKLPLGWLLLLLTVYLAVIGPIDYFVLKRLNKQMLTWITFPLYVVFFSALIYLIGYKLRAGEVEWNEFHVVDVMPSAENAAIMHGRAFCSIYSPSNARYALGAALDYASLREELGTAGYGGRGLESARSIVEQKGNACEASIAVPVWTSQLYVGDWWHATRQTPLQVTVSQNGKNTEVTIRNNQAYPLKGISIVWAKRMYTLEDIPARGVKSLTLMPSVGMDLSGLIASYEDRFYAACGYRHSALGADNHSRPTAQEFPRWSAMASFLHYSPRKTNYRTYWSWPAFDLTRFSENGDVIVLGYAENQLAVSPLCEGRFSPRRSHKNTLFRVVVPIKNNVKE